HDAVYVPAAGTVDRAAACLDVLGAGLGVFCALHLRAGLRHDSGDELAGLSGWTLRRPGIQTPPALYYEWRPDRYGPWRAGGGAAVCAPDWVCQYPLAVGRHPAGRGHHCPEYHQDVYGD